MSHQKQNMWPLTWYDLIHPHWFCQDLGAIKTPLYIMNHMPWTTFQMMLLSLWWLSIDISRCCARSRPASNQSFIRTVQCHGLSQIQGTNPVAILDSCVPKSLPQMVTLYLCLPQFSNSELWKTASITSILGVHLFIHFIQPTRLPVTENSASPGATGSAINGAVESSWSETCP